MVAPSIRSRRSRPRARGTKRFPTRWITRVGAESRGYLQELLLVTVRPEDDALAPGLPHRLDHQRGKVLHDEVELVVLPGEICGDLGEDGLLAEVVVDHVRLHVSLHVHPRARGSDPDRSPALGGTRGAGADGRGAGPDQGAESGGGLEFGESVAERLQKEFLEETGLTVSPGRFLFGCEFVQKPLHAIELYFEVAVMGGKLRKGEDPEMNIIEDVRYIKPGDIGLIPRQSLHGIFGLVGSAEELMTLTGFFRI